MGAWQPIDTAPNNVVLVTDGGYVMSACQNDGKWFTGWDWGGARIHIDLEPTHWMHLPDPPEGTEQLGCEVTEDQSRVLHEALIASFDTFEPIPSTMNDGSA